MTRSLKMKYAIIAAAATATILSGCSSMNPFGGDETAGLPLPEEATVPVKDKRITADFKDQGLILHYTMTGKLEKIDIYGTAPAWAGNHVVLAELDAKEKLLKFVYGESMDTNTQRQILAKTLEKAQDNTLNRFDNNNDLIFDARELEREFERSDNTPAAEPSNSSRRIAHRIESAVLEKAVTLTSQGRLTGMHKVDDGVSTSGRYYWAKYEWDERSQATSMLMRNKMK